MSIHQASCSDFSTGSALLGGDALTSSSACLVNLAIDADASGSGFLFGDSKATAMWVCGNHVLAVELLDVDTQGRDRRADARNLLVSMLPWACGGDEVPS